MRQITKNINKLKEKDITSILLYALYKITEDPEYSAISELAYTLDKDSFYKLCATFGGCTIKVPKLQDMEILTKTMLIIELMSNGMSFTDAYNEAGIDDSMKNQVLEMYDTLSDIVENFDAE